MPDLLELIKFENENSSLDFKATQYTRNEYEALLKDAMSLANADVLGDRHIITGVKMKPDGTRDFLGIAPEQFVDSATYQQLIHENIEPDIQISYEPVRLDNVLLGVFSISDCTDGPYMMKKDHGKLRKGDGYIRKGSQQSRLTRGDLDRIIASNAARAGFQGQVRIGFSGTDYADTICLAASSDLDLPSETAERRIRKAIEEKKRKLAMGQQVEVPSRFPQLDFFRFRPYEERTIEELEEALKHVSESYGREDGYYLFEEHGKRINIAILNNGEEYIEDASICLTFPKGRGILVSETVWREPQYGPMGIEMPDLDTSHMRYPCVDHAEDSIVVTEVLRDIKHLIPVDAFEEPLRVFVHPIAIGKDIPVRCLLYGRNLRSPIEVTLTVKVTDATPPMRFGGHQA